MECEAGSLWVSRGLVMERVLTITRVMVIWNDTSHQVWFCRLVYDWPIGDRVTRHSIPRCDLWSGGGDTWWRLTNERSRSGSARQVRFTALTNQRSRHIDGLTGRRNGTNLSLLIGVPPKTRKSSKVDLLDDRPRPMITCIWDMTPGRHGATD